MAPEPTTRDPHAEALLDAALEDTFPASDPVALEAPGRPERPEDA